MNGNADRGGGNGNGNGNGNKKRTVRRSFVRTIAVWSIVAITSSLQILLVASFLPDYNHNNINNNIINGIQRTTTTTAPTETHPPRTSSSVAMGNIYSKIAGILPRGGGDPLLAPPVASYRSNGGSDNINDDHERFGYATNPTVFGQILRGELPTRVFPKFETEHTIAFMDIHPRAPLHGLVIPKALVPSVLELSAATFQDGDGDDDDDDNNNPEAAAVAAAAVRASGGSLALLDEMKRVALDLVRDHQPEAYESGDYRLCFHVPPYNSVDHLHLHVLAPASSMSPTFGNGKYNTGSYGLTDAAATANPFRVRWCIGLAEVADRLERGMSPTPYSREDSWGTVWSDTFRSICAIFRQQSRSATATSANDDAADRDDGDRKSD